MAAPPAVPDSYLCPVTSELMLDPVATADGFTYEFAAIRQWLNKKETSPVTNERLESSRLIINHAVRKLIAGIVVEHIRVVRKRKKAAAAVEAEPKKAVVDQAEPKKKKKKQTAAEKVADAFLAANP